MKLLQAFGDDSFTCKNDCLCMAANGKSHELSAQYFSDRMSEYPPKMCDTFARLLAAEVRNLQRSESTSQKRGSASNRVNSTSEDEM